VSHVSQYPVGDAMPTHHRGRALVETILSPGLQRCPYCEFWFASPPRDPRLGKRQGRSDRVYCSASCRALDSRRRKVTGRPTELTPAVMPRTSPANRRRPRPAGDSPTPRLLAPRHLREAAHVAVAEAIADGSLTRPVRCELCHSEDRPIQAHHEDYTLPLTVTWLCWPCHSRRHHAIRFLFHDGGQP
jgi:hypothetical protein